MAPRTTAGIGVIRTLEAVAVQQQPDALRAALDQRGGVLARTIAPPSTRRHAPALNTDLQRAEHYATRYANAAARDTRALMLATNAVTARAAADATLAMWARYERHDPEVNLDPLSLARRVQRARAAATPEWGSRDQLVAQWAQDARVAVHRAAAGVQAANGSTRDLAHAVADAARAEEWKLARILRTEAAFSFNAAQQESIVALAEEYPDVRKRWTELVDDRTGRPLDKRVAADSLALHGQVALPDGLFVMPAGVSSPPPGTWLPYPPNRPNDRAVVTPWRRGWGIPAWTVGRDGATRRRLV
jgi:hypothetical protein